MAQGVQQLNSLMKYVLPENPVSLIPDGVKLYKTLPEIQEAEQAGRKLLVPVELTSEGGVTYGDGSAFAYESTVDGLWGEAQLDCQPVVLNMELSKSAVDRLSNNKVAFTNVATLKTKSMYKELSRRAETSMFYGKSPKGLGTVGATTGTSGTSLVVTWTAGQWAAGFWAGRKGHRYEFRTSAGVGHAGHTTNLLTLASVDWTNKKCTFTGNAGEIATVVANDVCYYRGSYVNDMVGLDGILTTSGNIFNIDNTVYDLWKGCENPALTSLTIAEFMKAFATPVAIGGLADDTVTYLNNLKLEGINATITNANYRNSGGRNDVEIKIGQDMIKFITQAGTNTLIGSNYVKEADSFTFSQKQLRCFGTKKISFEANKGKGDYWLELQSNYGARMQGAYEFAIMLDCPAQAMKTLIP